MRGWPARPFGPARISSGEVNEYGALTQYTACSDDAAIDAARKNKTTRQEIEVYMMTKYTRASFPLYPALSGTI